MAIKQFGKKGIFLTFISIAIIAAAILIFTPSDVNLKKDLSVVKTRVSNVNEYVLDLENVYLERTLQATGRRTIIALIKYMEAETIRTGTEVFFSDGVDDSLYFKDVFSQVLLDGTIGDTPQTLSEMTGNTYNDRLGEITTTAKNAFNIDTVYGISEIRVSQTGPWFVEVEADLSFNVSSETATWNKTATIKTEISVEGFEDPYYLVKTSGIYKNTIRKSGTQFDEWTVDKVNDFIADGNYTHFENSNAPSFIMRFYEDTSASSCCGIESIIDPNDLAILDLPSDVALRYIDYKFFPLWNFPNPPPPPPDCEDVTQTLYTENDVDRLFNNIKFDLDDLGRYKFLKPPLERFYNIEQLCPTPPP